MSFNLPPPPTIEDINAASWKLWFQKLQSTFSNLFVTISQGGTGLTSLGTSGQVLLVNSGATALEYSDIPRQQKRVLTHNITSGTLTYNCDWSQYDEIRLWKLNDAETVTLTFSGAVNGQGCILELKNPNFVLPVDVQYNDLVTTYIHTGTVLSVDKLGFIYNSTLTTYVLVAVIPNIQ